MPRYMILVDDPFDEGGGFYSYEKHFPDDQAADEYCANQSVPVGWERIESKEASGDA